MQLSVIIVNYNVKYFLEQCLCSVTKACQNVAAEIFVVDNNSTDGSKAFLEPQFPGVHFIWNSINEGFAKACNQALAAAKGEIILFLNPDTILPEDCFEKCLDFFKSTPFAGALGIRMIDGTGNFLKESKRSFPSPMTSLFKLIGLTALFPHSHIFAKYYLGHLTESENHEVSVLAGAFMMIPKKVLDKTGSFDERFFMYGEDVDLSYRIREAGFTNYYFAESTIIHFKGESTRKGSLNYVRLFYKAMSLFVKKHYSGGRAGLFNFFIQIGIWFSAVIAAVGGFFQRIANRVIGKRLTNSEDTAGEQTIIVSNEKDFAFMTNLIQRSGTPSRVLGRVDNSSSINDSALGNIQQLPGLIKKYDVKEIIFCENGVRFKEIISTIQQLPAGIRNKFHASGSSSIVGSDSKDRSGDYISDPNVEIIPALKR